MLLTILLAILITGASRDAQARIQGFNASRLNSGEEMILHCRVPDRFSREINATSRFQWEWNGLDVQDELVTKNLNMSSEVVVGSVTPDIAGWWTCKLNNESHTARIDVSGIRKIVTPQEAFIKWRGADGGGKVFQRRSKVGEVVNLYCPYTGNPPSTIRWTFKGRPLHGGSDKLRMVEVGRLEVTNVSQHEEGVYVCTVEDEDSLISSASIHLGVSVPPVLRPFSFWSGLVEGGRGRVSCEAVEGDSPLQFSWSRSGSEVPRGAIISQGSDGFSSTLSFPLVLRSHAGLYTCVVNNTAGRAHYTAQLKVNHAPEWEKEPIGVSLKHRGTLLLDCAANGQPIPSVQWSRQGNQPLTSSNHIRIFENGTLYIEKSRVEDEGRYTCRASNSIPPDLVKVVSVDVDVGAHFLPDTTDMSRTLANMEESVRVRAGKKMVLSCNPLGDKPIRITWLRGSHKLHKQPFNDHVNNSRFKVKEDKNNGSPVSKLILKNAELADSGIYTCIAANTFAAANKTFHLLVQDVPGPIQSLQILDYSARSVNLTWSQPEDNNSPISTFLLATKQFSESWTSAKEDRIYGNTYATVLSGLIPDTMYSFRVRGGNSVGLGDPSPVQSVRTSQDKPDGQPRLLSARPTSSQSILISWKAPEKQLRNGLILGYNIFYRPTDTKDLEGVILQETVHLTDKEDREKEEKFELKDLKKFTEYSISVEAINPIGAGPRTSPSVLSRTLQDVPSGSPQKVECSGSGSRTVEVSWSDPPESKVHGILLGFNVFFSPLLEWEENPEEKNFTTTERRAKISKLKIWQNYTVYVSALTKAGIGVRSEPVYCSTLESVSGAPANVKAVPASVSSVLVSWLPPTQQNGRILYYKVYMKTMSDGQPYTNLLEVYPPDESWIYDNLNLDQPYSWSLTAVTSAGEGPRSITVTESPQRRSRTAPTILGFSTSRILALGEEVELSCRSIADPPPSTDWLLNGQPLDNTELVTQQGNLRFEKVTLSDSGNYSCRAFNSLGEDTIFYSLQVKLSRSNGVVPYPPSLEIQTVERQSLTVKWGSHPTGGCPVTSYTIYYRRDAGSWEHTVLPPTPLQATISGLRCGSRYFLKIVATNRIGSSPTSNQISVVTKGSPPVAPSQDNLIFITSGLNVELRLSSWEDGGCNISSFVVEYRVGREQWHLLTNLLSPKSRSFTIREKLESGRDYQIRMTAHNSAGSTQHTYTLLNGTVSEANQSLILGPGSGSGLTGWTVLVALLVTVLALLAFIIRRKQKRIPAQADASLYLDGVSGDGQMVIDSGNYLLQQPQISGTPVVCNYYVPVDSKLAVSPGYAKYEDPDSLGQSENYSRFHEGNKECFHPKLRLDEVAVPAYSPGYYFSAPQQDTLASSKYVLVPQASHMQITDPDHVISGRAACRKTMVSDSDSDVDRDWIPLDSLDSVYRLVSDQTC